MMLATSATIHVPSLTALAITTTVLLTALGLLIRYVVRPLSAATRWVRTRLDEISDLVDWQKDTVQFIGLFGADIEARLDRIERTLKLGPYHRRATDPPGPPALHSALVERLKAYEEIRNLGRDDPPTGKQ